MSEQLGVSSSQVHWHIKKAYDKIRREVNNHLSDTKINLLLFICLKAGKAPSACPPYERTAKVAEDYNTL